MEVIKMFNVGRMCVKIAGRDAGKQCVIVQKIDDKTVLIDGETRRRNCNVCHLEPLDKTITISSGATHAQVKTAFAELGLVVLDTKPKKAGVKPVSQKAKKAVPAKEEKPKKVAKKAPKKKEEVKEEPLDTPEEEIL
jgi:large subunit ribosomal protein L14e